MGLTMTGKAVLAKPMRCNWCGRKSMELVKIHSHEDKSTLRICERHWLEMPAKPRDWDLWVAANFPKWDKKVYHRDSEEFLAEAKHFMKIEHETERIFGNEKGNSKGDSGDG